MSTTYTLVHGRPPVSTGGFLCEEMGLGKTVEMLALLLANPYDAAVANARLDCLTPARARLLTPSQATLVVVPVSLLAQWESEVDKCVQAGKLKVALWHGERRQCFNVTLYGVRPQFKDEVLTALVETGLDATAAAAAVSKASGNPELKIAHNYATELVSSAPTGWTQAEAERLVARIEQMKGKVRAAKVKLGSSLLRPDYLAGFDLVLTTYDMVLAETRNASNNRPLTRVHWWHVVLDESQRISNSTTAITRVCCSLPRVHSWLMSGTPVGNVVEDLLGQLLFLGVEPYCRMGKNVGAQSAECSLLSYCLATLICILSTRGRLKGAGGLTHTLPSIAFANTAPSLSRTAPSPLLPPVVAFAFLA
jgi:SNF2 family DNA or RNA helicase